MPENETIGSMVDAIYELRKERDRIKDELKDIESKISTEEFKVLKLMESSNVDKISTTKATASRKVELYPQVQDINALVNWAAANGRADILQRRVSAGVFKEIYEQTGAYPDGTDTYNKETLNFRKRG